MTSRSFTRGLAAAGLAFSVALSAAPAAGAAESPEAVAYGMDWIRHIHPADLPPVAQRKVVCLVDSGVDITADLPTNRFEGPIVDRVAIDGGSGLGGFEWENQHGTRMASLGVAVSGPEYGTDGAFPAVRIVSVRAMSYSERLFPGPAYQQGVRVCNNAFENYPLAVINLSLGCRCQLDLREQNWLEDAIARVQAPHKSVNVVAAAGNEGGGLTAPADVRGVVPVAAGNGDGELCEYASYDARALVGPGCGAPDITLHDVLDSGSGGSSGAAMHASVLLAVLRTLRPHAGHQEAEGWVRAGARKVTGRAMLNGEASARVAGLGAVVDRARARMGAVQGQPPATSSPSGGPAVPAGVVTASDPSIASSSRPARRAESQGRGSALKAPVADAEWRQPRLHVRLHWRPSSAKKLIVRASWRSRGRTRTVLRSVPARAAVTVPFRTRPLRISLAYAGQPVDGRTPRSSATVLRHTAGGVYR